MTAVIPLIVLAIVFILIAVRQKFNRLCIWQIMLAGALVVLLTGQISPRDALSAINVDVLLFLFCMFVVGGALHESGALAHLSFRLFKRAKNADQLMLLIISSMGLLSAVLMNDTLAIIGTPLVLSFAKQYGVSPKLALLALAFAVTIGSVMSPIGNPQNLLIALDGGIENPFVVFFGTLAAPTLINLMLAYVVLKLFYPGQFQKTALQHVQEPITDRKLAALSESALVILVALIAVRMFTAFLNVGVEIELTYIALAAAAPILILSERRAEIVKKIDWSTLVFFAAMFVLMTSVWNTGFFQHAIDTVNIDVTSTPIILVVSVALSQLISNVPFVALYLPLLTHAGASAEGLMALAAGSTIAGNLLILGAASNVIIIQNSEKQGETLTFFEFARVGVPLTVLNVAVYWLFFTFV